MSHAAGPPKPRSSSARTSAGGRQPPTTLGSRAAAALVFGSSASVLVVELVALRLLAPHLGLTLETSTLVIGVALAAIALGSWAGGRLADVMPPRRALAPLLGVSGVAVALTPVAVRSAGAAGQGVLLMLVASLSIIVPGALLAAVTPMVTKLRLHRLADTGKVVGQLSGIGTAGGIFGTVMTGFVLIARVPISGIMIGLGAALVGTAAVLELRGGSSRMVSVSALIVGISGGAVLVAPRGCDAETTYHCASVVTDPARPSGRTLMLDGAPHSYVDLEDPTYLAFDYAKAVASVIDTAYPADQVLRAYHIGGGGLTVPRYLRQVRPNSPSLVSEIDPGVVRVDVERLQLELGAGIDVRVEDARLGLGRLADDSRDLVVGDAFGGVSVPWHLTTREALTEVDRVLDEDGSYVLNLLDYGPLAFARAEVATLAAVFEHVALATEIDTLTSGPKAGGNLVVVASDAPIDVTGIGARMTARGIQWQVITGPELSRWTGEAPVLSDDYAPVDQLLSPYSTR
ncbi:MAG TPA: fused MFS/spermidine synthase [Propionibacteriaceae bacterium]|nr:fused MFS/spermidine synthase [Propionibacteriaceae bacterium]